MTKLAIKGHPTRGKEIIQLLEMLGGMNKFEDISFITPYIFLFVDDDYYTEIGWDFIGDDNNYEEFVIYTLEEFEEKYPYKVGDTVACYAGLLLEKEIHTITGMYWDSNKCRIQYHIDNGNVLDARDILYSIECKTEQSNPKEEKTFPPYMDYDIKEDKETFKPSEGTLVQIDLTKELRKANNIEVILGDYEFVLKNGKTYFVKKKPQYPKTYAECCRVLGISDGEFMFTGLSDDEYDLFDSFVVIKRCRDAYWKIAGEELGLDKPWEFENPSKNWVFTIEYAAGCIYKHAGMNILYNHILVFPTEEMRDAFYENFKDLIESCKELL